MEATTGSPATPENAGTVRTAFDSPVAGTRLLHPQVHWSRGPGRPGRSQNQIRERPAGSPERAKLSSLDGYHPRANHCVKALQTAFGVDETARSFCERCHAGSTSLKSILALNGFSVTTISAPASACASCAGSRVENRFGMKQQGSLQTAREHLTGMEAAVYGVKNFRPT